MGKELTHIHYVNCPSCLTLFKPRDIPRKLSDKIRCICCNDIFLLSQSTLNKNISPKPKVRHGKRNLPTLISKTTNKTDKYLRRQKIKANIIFISWLATPFLLLTLSAGAIYKYKDFLAQDLQYRQYVQTFCSIMKCQLPRYSNLDYIVVEDNAIVSVPEKEDTIQLFAMLSNIGKYDQKFPTLQVKFTDINGRLIKEKIIKPEEYIKNYKKNKTLLNSNSKQYVAMQLQDPGLSAVNYEIFLNK